VTGRDLFRAADGLRKEEQFHDGMLIMFDLFAAGNWLKVGEIKVTVSD